ncbi:phosphopyruvate hydratase [Paracoccus seriniphilus]|uniref:Enolase n=1 Tax=Paracoccus seriniphilus TaxID=184748 RepID=A0A239PUE7_9RHOB|nr:phosphopyruvate hydratase [Paracoccus seriniphilus]WCR16438.1 phosphopyruvate hydratase [Paracoccus seriniphilus]SNT73552.1 enolase [Paracoccus seriniphilus]
MTETDISSIRARRVWDSRGRPTIETEVTLAGGAVGRAIAPAGASRGSREALDLRDGGDRLGGMDVTRAIAAIDETLAPALLGRDVRDQQALDQTMIELDGTPLKSRLGGNAIVATSLALMHAAANQQGVPLWRHLAQVTGRKPSIPLPEIQIFGGGAHAGRRVDIQDFMVMVPGAADFAEALDISAEIHAAAGSLMAQQGRRSGVADEGGWWPAFDSNEQALETLTRAIELAGETPGKGVVISLDIAASEFGQNGRYRLALDQNQMDTDGMIALLSRWIDSYAIASIEDPLAEDDVAGMTEFTRHFSDRLQIIGDDYLVTNAALLEQAAQDEACNAVLIKVNQAGTVSESLATMQAADKAGYRCIVSARSGETEDVSIAHMSVGLGAGQLKVGSMTRSERMAKWNEVLRIAEDPDAGTFVGGAPLGSAWQQNGE